MGYESELGNIKMALGGDFMLTRGLSAYREESFLKLRDIFRQADVGFVNFESSVHNYLEGHHNLAGGSYPTTEPRFLEDMRWFGINLVSCANSHSFDYGEEGIMVTRESLNKAGIINAGTGRHLREARSPSYLETAQGRVGLVSFTSHYWDWTIAGEQRVDTPGRPGVNPLRFTTSYTIDSEGIKALKRLGAALGFDAAAERHKNLGDPAREDVKERYKFLGKVFSTGDSFQVVTTADRRDVEANLQQVREARGMADWVMVSFHYHEAGGPKLLTATEDSEVDEPSGFVREFARACVREGADVIACHGPHLSMGIEIFEGKPIFYSLGALAFQIETIQYLPDEAYSRYRLASNGTPSDFLNARYQGGRKGHPVDRSVWHQVAAACRFESHRLKTIELYPVDLGYGKCRPQRGRPLLADPAVGEMIIERLQDQCRREGTDLRHKDGRGIISL